jgi:hypothetical protein
LPITTKLELQPNFADALYNRGAAKYNTQGPYRRLYDWETAQKLGNAEAGKMKAQYCRTVSFGFSYERIRFLAKNSLSEHFLFISGT